MRFAVGHTGDTIRNAYLRDAAELVRKAALGADALAEIRSISFSVMQKGYNKIFCISTLA